MVSCYDIKVEYLENPVGIDEIKPRFSWKISGTKNSIMQTAYRIIVSAERNVWDSGKVEGGESVNIEYAGDELQPFTRYDFSIKIWDSNGNESDSVAGFFETGSITHTNFSASWITTQKEDAGICPVFRKEFCATKEVKRARMYVTALGLYEIKLNGERVGDSLLTPGYTAYNTRLQYQVYEIDVNQVNAVSATLAKGWYRGSFGWNRKENIYGSDYGLFIEIHINYEDGTKELICSDDSWKYGESPFELAELYDGEIYDASKYIEYSVFGAEEPLKSARILDYPMSRMIAQQNEPVRIIDRLKPVRIIKSPEGEVIIDFGQNLSGWVEFTVEGEKGDRVEISHAEVLDADGNFYTENMRTAKNKICYILKGDESGEGNKDSKIKKFHPRFSFQGFRYIRIDEFPGEISMDKFTAHVIHSDLKMTGSFKCSNDDLNKLFKNIIWGQKGNFIDIPTDCPQRDERMGWTGDAQVFIKAAAMNMNVAVFFTKWLKDLAAEQNEDGSVPDTIPNPANGEHCSAAWGDAALICPWEIYNAYGDTRILQAQYESMKKWIGYIYSQGENKFLWNTGDHYGDWLGLDAAEGSYKGATSEAFIATAYFAHSTWILTQAAGVLGREEDRQKYARLFTDIKNEFNKAFVTGKNTLADNTQTAYSLALHFNLVDDKAAFADKLAELVRDNDYKLATGFVGTPYILHALSDNGYEDIAYTLLLNTEYPSWLYPVKMGATTIWEHWDGIKLDGSFWSADMNSFNHYAYGAVADWMYTKLAGINYAEPGYKKAVIKPLPNKSLRWAEARIDTMHGQIYSRWEYRAEEIKYTVSIPPNISASFVYPGGKTVLLGSGEFEL